jgi:hypothetical protein
VEELCKGADGSTALRAEWAHQKSVSSAYWDSRGRSIVSTSYDDTVRCMASPCALRTVVFIRIAVWDINSSMLDGDDKFPSKQPSKQISHDCQTVRHLNPSHLLDSPNAETTGQMVDDPQSAMDTEPGRLSALHDRQHETFPRHILCEGGPACKTLG